MEFRLQTRKTLMWGRRVDYILTVPLSSPPQNGWPVLLFLHGYKSGTVAENDRWLGENWIRHIRRIRHLRRTVVVTPICPRNRWWVSSSMVGLLSEIGELDFQTDASRTYAMGFSMGAYCVWSILCSHPSLFAAAVPISGGGKPDGRTAVVVCNACACTFPLSPHLFAVNVCHGTSSGGFQLSSLPGVSTHVWALHSRSDTVVPFTETVRNVELLREDLSKLTLYNDLTHEETFNQAMLHMGIYNWVFSKSNNSIRSQRMIRS